MGWHKERVRTKGFPVFSRVISDIVLGDNISVSSDVSSLDAGRVARTIKKEQDICDLQKIARCNYFK